MVFIVIHVKTNKIDVLKRNKNIRIISLSSDTKCDSIESDTFTFLFVIVVQIGQFLHGYAIHTTPS